MRGRVYDQVMDTKTKFAEGDLVEYVGVAFQRLLVGLQGTLVTNREAATWPWRLVLTPEAQAVLRKEDIEAGVRWVEQDRLDGWLVSEDEIRKVEA